MMMVEMVMAAERGEGEGDRGVAAAPLSRADLMPRWRLWPAPRVVGPVPALFAIPFSPAVQLCSVL